MINRKSYEYKDINLYGIGTIPENWDLIRLNRVAEVIDPEPRHRAPAFAVGDGYPYVGIRDINYDGTVNVETARPIEEGSLIEQEKRFKIGDKDIVFCRVATLGHPKILKVNTRIALSATLALIKSKSKIVNEYLLYYLDSDPIRVQTSLFATGSTRKSLGMETIRKFRIIMPPFEEQVRIAKYLKSTIDAIEAIIKAKQDLISLLDEQRQAIITHAVTKGLNPNAKMKDSGVEWIGEIPEHWEVKKIRRIVSEHKQGFYSTEEYNENGIKLIRITDINKKSKVDTINSPRVTISDKEKSIFKVQRGDFLFARTGGAGSFGLIENDEEAVFASYLIRFRFVNEIFENFLKYYFISDAFKNGIKRSIHGGVNQNVHAEDIKNQTMILPSFVEQNSIAAFLDLEIIGIDNLVDSINLHIQKLKEYRQSLIYEAVTGKIDVRDFEEVIQ